MYYKDASIYTDLLTPRERKFFDQFIGLKDCNVDELKQNIQFMKFKNGQKMIRLFKHLDSNGYVVGSSGSTGESTREVKESKLTFKKSAYRRWKRKGWLKDNIVTLKGQKFKVTLEGKIVNLTELE